MILPISCLQVTPVYLGSPVLPERRVDNAAAGSLSSGRRHSLVVQAGLDVPAVARIERADPLRVGPENPAILIEKPGGGGDVVQVAGLDGEIPVLRGLDERRSGEAAGLEFGVKLIVSQTGGEAPLSLLALNRASAACPISWATTA